MLWIGCDYAVFQGISPENLLDLFLIYEYNRYDVFNVRICAHSFLAVKQEHQRSIQEIKYLIFYIYGWEKEVSLI